MWQDVLAFSKEPMRLNPDAMIAFWTAEQDGDCRGDCIFMLAEVVRHTVRFCGSVDDVLAVLIGACSLCNIALGRY